jgi:hypothetical protein
MYDDLFCFCFLRCDRTSRHRCIASRAEPVTVRVQDVATADELFKRALAVDCTDSSVSGSYVEFFQKHLEADYRRGCLFPLLCFFLRI